MDADHPLFERRTRKNPARMLTERVRDLVDEEPGSYIETGVLMLGIAAVYWLMMLLIDWGILLRTPHEIGVGVDPVREFSGMLSAAIMNTAPLLTLIGVVLITMGFFVSWIQRRGSRHTDTNKKG